MQVCATILVSGTLCWAVVVPILQINGVIEGAGFAALSCSGRSGSARPAWWPLGLLNFALSWRSALRAFRDLGQMLSFRSAAASGRSRIEASMSWFAVGQIVSLVALARLGARELRYACLAKCYCGGVVILTGAGRLSRDGRDRIRRQSAQWVKSPSLPSAR